MSDQQELRQRREALVQGKRKTGQVVEGKGTVWIKDVELRKQPAQSAKSSHGNAEKDLIQGNGLRGITSINTD